jgi:hypothetical protein
MNENKTYNIYIGTGEDEEVFEAVSEVCKNLLLRNMMEKGSQKVLVFSGCSCGRFPYIKYKRVSGIKTITVFDSEKPAKVTITEL